MISKARILVTGSNRSGSTWVGRVLESHSQVDTIVEPLNLNRIQRYKRIDYSFWYPKITRDNPDAPKIKSLIDYYLNVDLLTFLTQFFKSYEGHSFWKSVKKRWRRAKRPIKVLKDPTALFSVPWIVEEFTVKPILLIRHPAAYVLSIKEKNWWFDFDNFLKQPNFFSGRLVPLKNEVNEFKKSETTKDIIDNAALLWKVFYTQVLEYQEKYPEWFFITHEELSIEPLKNYNLMCQYLGLEFRESMKDFIIETTQAKENEEFKRDAVKNTEKWKKKLSEHEKNRIYTIVKNVSDQYYKKWI